MVLGTIVLLGGVTFFSYIMSSIIEIIESFSESTGESIHKE